MSQKGTPSFSGRYYHVHGNVDLEYELEPLTSGGDMFIQGNIFCHFIAPDYLPPMKKNIIFVIDESGSMGGQRISQTKLAFNYIINDIKGWCPK